MSSGSPNLTELLNGGAGQALQNEGTSAATLAASISGGAIAFGVQFLIFYLLKDRLKRIFRPRTFLVPEKERTKPPPPGLFRWVLPVFTTSNSEFIQKCGLDAYFFIRYLRLLLKIFCVLALVIIPILLPINAVGGIGVRSSNEGALVSNVTGLDTLGWQNVAPEHTSRFWAHCVLAVLTIVYVCYIFFDELKGYIRLRQAYLTTPEHRLRASATTILVTNIPKKWLTAEALDGLFDVFPGGLRNIWINRNYDDLGQKVDRRDQLARQLETAETDLIKKAQKIHFEQANSGARRKAGLIAKTEVMSSAGHDVVQFDGNPEEQGISSGDPHQIPHSFEEALDEAEQTGGGNHKHKKGTLLSLPVFGHGLGAVGQGVGLVGRGVDRLGRGFTGGLVNGVNKARLGLDERLEAVDLGNSFAPATVEEQTGHASELYPDQHGDAVHPSLHTSKTPITEGSVDCRFTLRPSNDPFNPVRSSGIAGRHALPPPVVENPVEANTKSKLSFWIRGKRADFPSPQPHQREDDEYPLSQPRPALPAAHPSPADNGRGTDGASDDKSRTVTRNKSTHECENAVSEESEEYPKAYNEAFADDKGDSKPMWRQYVSEKDRPTHHLAPFGKDWLAWLSWTSMGKKVDTIYYCRKELARMNVEIEQDQQHPEKFPLMSSAFIQFNHQVAAHMACQSVSHHLPQSMTPRMIEIDPKDVKWKNMSVKWWERFVRTIGMLVLFVCSIFLFAIPVTFSGLLSKVGGLQRFSFLNFLQLWPQWAISVVQGILPQLILSIVLLLVPVVINLLAGQQGPATGAAQQLSVANYYFTFLFIQLFLVISISSGIMNVIQDFINNFGATVSSVPSILAQNLPKASDYFFSYMILQAFGVSAGALVQIGPLFGWFGLSNFDSTARQKFQRQISLPSVEWGTFFPVYTNLAAIGLIYSVITPIILLFNILTFSLFWVVYRYNTLYVSRFTFDTGGLLFPQAINQLFTGVYVMELCLVGLFFLVRDSDGMVACEAQAIIMIVVTVVTIIFQILLNDAFGPLFKYLPITLEDDAVRRDEEFARAQMKRFRVAEEEQEDDSIEYSLRTQEPRERTEGREAENIELESVGVPRKSRSSPLTPDFRSASSRVSWADRSSNRRVSSHIGAHPLGSPHRIHPGGMTHILRRSVDQARHTSPRASAVVPKTDIEAQRNANDGIQSIADQLFSNISDELEDLSPEERDVLVQHAFQHSALRARRPCIWIPNDASGVSDDEIARTGAFAGNNIWISNQGTGLDKKGRVVFSRAPPDYSEWDLVQL